MRSSASPTMAALSLIVLTITTLATVLTGPASSFPHSAFDSNRFKQCINSKSDPSKPPSGVYPSTYPAFSAILNSTAENLKCLARDVPRPLLIVTPYTELEAKMAVFCAGWQGVNLRVRSGGHDYECLSYASFTGKPFVVLDLQKLRNVAIDLKERTAWVQAGTTLGELYYKVANASDGTLGFPAGLFTTLGVAGNFLGGGYGMMLRQHGLAVDNVVDVCMVLADGRTVDRQTMGEDLFWAVRGGAGGSFGVLLSWKVQLVQVPPKVTVFNSVKTVEQQGIDLLYKWQSVAPATDRRLFMRVIMQVIAPAPGHETVMTLYNTMFLGNKSDLLMLLGKEFPELGVTAKDCMEVSWIEAVVFIGGYPASTKPEYLLERKPAFQNSFKSTSDYVKTPVPKAGLQGLVNAVLKNNRSAVLLTPYGGRMADIPSHATPFPHRDALYMVQYVGQWSPSDKWPEARERNGKWVRDVHSQMTPYVSKNPREAYANYRDLDIGRDERKCFNCSCPHIWGPKYFTDNFQRLVSVKSKVDPFNFFSHEQSIPTFSTLDRCTNLVS